MNQTKRAFFSWNDFTFLIVLMLSFYLISWVNFVLFHSLIETSIFIIGFLTFAFSWHLRRFELGNLLMIGILLGCSSVISVFHMLSYKGMSVFTTNPDIPTQLWIASRYMFSTVLLIAFSFPRTRMNPHLLLTAIGALTTALIILVFTGNFPHCYSPKNGLSDFKIYSEYVISGILFIAFCLYWKNRRIYLEESRLPLILFFSFSIVTELVFTSYLGVYDFSNMLGHIFHFLSFYIFYKAIVKTGLEDPFDSMFHSLNNAVKSRDEFISMASHELKTPLTPLKIHLQMLQKKLASLTPDTESQVMVSKLARSTDEQVDKLNRLIDGMLDVSRLSTGKFQLFLEDTELKPLLVSLVKNQEEMIQKTRSTVTLNLTDARKRVDPLRIEQVVTNLLVNALKYAPGSEIEVGLNKMDDGKISIWVRDTGPGITKNSLERIFERFERDSNNASGGLGLGLFISRQIIEAHNGTLKVESATDQGTLFMITL